MGWVYWGEARSGAFVVFCKKNLTTLLKTKRVIMKPPKHQHLVVLALLFAVFTLFYSCKKDQTGGTSGNGQTNTETINSPDLEVELGQTELNQVQGILLDGELPVVNATVRCGFGAESVQTDPNGFFLLSACESYDRYGFITAEAPGYFTSFRRETVEKGVPPGNSSRGTAGLVPRRT